MMEKVRAGMMMVMMMGNVERAQTIGIIRVAVVVRRSNKWTCTSDRFVLT